jgi:hypothetical protein
MPLIFGRFRITAHRSDGVVAVMSESVARLWQRDAHSGQDTADLVRAGIAANPLMVNVVRVNRVNRAWFTAKKNCPLVHASVHLILLLCSN